MRSSHICRVDNSSCSNPRDRVTTGTIIGVSNAVYLVCMGICPSIWGPLSHIYGRRPNCIASASLFTAFSIGTALAPILPAFFVFRLLTALFGTAFFVVGTAAIGDIYPPTERGTAVSWFLSGTLIGPCFAPLIGGIIITYAPWSDIFWMQAGLGGLATILVVACLPETIPSRAIDTMSGSRCMQRTIHILYQLNPTTVTLLLVSSLNLWMVGLASSALMFNMYSLLTPIRYVLNDRFRLASPLQSGLLFLAPGLGYLVGTCFGGRLSDAVVKLYIKKRGRRIPEDRLRAATPFLGIVSPVCMLIYGWAVEKEVGGIALPVITMFVQGVAQLLCFPSLNVYCVDVAQGPSQSAMIVAGNYQIRYAFAATGSVVCLPGIRALGVGWFSTITALFMIASAVMLQLVIWYGEGWRQGNKLSTSPAHST
ncbi:synaptic vesicle transporter [Aspergillus heterothallicus]